MLRSPGRTESSDSGSVSHRRRRGVAGGGFAGGCVRVAGAFPIHDSLQQHRHLRDGWRMPSDLFSEGGLKSWFAPVLFLFSEGFRTFWIRSSSVFVIVRIRLAVSSLRGFGVERRIGESSVENTIRPDRRGLISMDESFQRSEFIDIRASKSGSSRNTMMKLVGPIVGDGMVQVTGWMDGEKVDDLAFQVPEEVEP